MVLASVTGEMPMLISHKYRFIFIKTRKTAGTSIEVDLSHVMDANDVVTEIFPTVEGHSPRNFVIGSHTCVNHMKAKAVRKVVGDDVFGSYFKFCVEREPVDKCISHYSMLKNSADHNSGNQSLTWEEYVERGDFPVDHKKYLGADGELLVDKIIKYETLNADLIALMGSLQVPFKGLTTQAKAGFRDRPFDVSDAVRERIYQEFRQSNGVTGYRL
jgi:hypothetical protein